MNCIKDEILENVLEYIRKFQAENGISPSYRKIMHAFNFSSVSKVNRIVSILQSRGLIEKANIGGIEVPFSFKKDSSLIAPLIGTVTCGNPISAFENYEGNFSISEALCGNGISFILHAKGDSMINAGIRDQDLLFIRKTDSADDGEIVVALLEESSEATVKRLFHKNGKVILHPENERYEDIIRDDVKILGVVASYIHKFNG